MREFIFEGLRPRAGGALLKLLLKGVSGQHMAENHVVLACRVVEPDDVAERSC
jgi:hypothetical protein